MNDREIIRKMFVMGDEDVRGNLTMEVLLDIRDLLQKPQSITVNVSGDISSDDVKQIVENVLKEKNVLSSVSKQSKPNTTIINYQAPEPEVRHVFIPVEGRLKTI